MSLDFFHYIFNDRNSKPAYFQHNYISKNETDQGIVSEYDQEIPQSQTAGKPMTPRGRATQQSLDTRKTN